MSDIIRQCAQARQSFIKEHGSDRYAEFAMNREDWQLLWDEVRETALEKSDIPKKAPETAEGFRLFGLPVRITNTEIVVCVDRRSGY